jgi:tRNA threonylcarbamoyl adenosine modification protein YeaZ
VRVLAVDTTTARGSLAVVGEEGVLAEARVVTGEGHSRWLLPAAQDLLRGLAVEARDIDGFAVTTGPGSFTGLRVGLSSVQGLALGSGRPCVGKPALDVLAALVAGASSALVALMDAFRGELYWGVFDGRGELQGKHRVGPLGELLAHVPPGAAFVGDAAFAHRRTIESAVPGALFPSVDLFLAAPLGRLALAELVAGRSVPPSALRPLYLRGADIRQPAR